MHSKHADLMKKILGPNIVLLSSTIFTKYPPNENQKSKNFAGDFVGWHQDLKYWGTTIFSGKVIIIIIAKSFNYIFSRSCWSTPKRKNQISNQSRAVTRGGHLDFSRKILITRHI